MTLKLKTATSLVVSALLGSPAAEAFAPSFAIRELSIAATATASNGMAQNIGSDRTSSSSSSSSIGSSMSSASGSISSSIGGSTIISGGSSSMGGSNIVSSSSSSSSSSSLTGSSINSINSSSSSSSSLTGSSINSINSSSSSSSSSSTSGDCTTSSAASGTLGAMYMSRDGRKRSAPPYCTRTPTTAPFGGTGSSSSSSQPSMALSFRVDTDMCIADPDASGDSMGSHAEPLIPPEPGGVSISGEVEMFPELAPWACADDRPWRKRARHARRVAALGIDGYGWEAKEEEEEEEERVKVGKAGGEGVGGVASNRVVGGEVGRPRTGERKRRASEKTEVKALRKECASKALKRNAMPIMDLVGVTAPLFVIVGISIVQNGPGP